MLREILKTFVEALFPRTCFVCGSEGAWLCLACVANMDLVASITCPGCGRATAHGETCLSCKDNIALNGLTTFAKYQEQAGVGKLIKAVKYKRATSAVEALDLIWAEGLGNAAITRLDPLKKATIVPVPLHRSRLNERGFNQAELIAKSLASVLDKPLVLKSLVRVKKTTQQIKLKKSERRENVKDAFKYVSRSIPESVMLIDDVYTTGATMNEAARALKNAGVRFVWGVAVARD